MRRVINLAVVHVNPGTRLSMGQCEMPDQATMSSGHLERRYWGNRDKNLPRFGMVIACVCCWIGGILLGRLVNCVWFLMIPSAVFVLLACLMVRYARWRGVQCWALSAVVSISGAWSVLHIDHVAGDHISGFLGHEPRLAEVISVLEGAPTLQCSKRRLR